MTHHAGGVTIAQNLHSLLGAFSVGLHQDKLSVVNKGCGISVDDVVR